jgi:hypothetical protein
MNILPDTPKLNHPLAGEGLEQLPKDIATVVPETGAVR